ncbi:PEGA domain-containing protein [Candidatus Daviesbacteria bacterium]|nr:PEGA domain-containing protein [Candidatus Daviesbacteria bacterium]
MKKALFIILVLIALIAILVRYGYEPLTEAIGIKSRAGLRVEALPESSVLVNNQELGKTPLQKEDYTPGEYLITIKNDKGSWQGYVKLTSGTLTVVNREINENNAKSSGEIIGLEEGEGAIIISTPQGATLEIDGKLYGKTPIKIDNLAQGEHTFLISHNNFLKRSIRIAKTLGYALNLKVDLAISEADLTAITSSPVDLTKSVKIKTTPTGFLRVREKPSLTSNEISKVSSGETLILLEEIPDWYKVRLKDSKEGYISFLYAEKL